MSLSVQHNIQPPSDHAGTDVLTLHNATESAASYFEENTDPHDRYLYGVERMVCQHQSSYQRISIADTYTFGRALMLDGAVQSTQSDEALYHELLIQPAMLRHQDAKDVLIIGGGEGAALREVLAHRSVHSATMVDLDIDVVELCRIHLPTWHCGAFDDPRARMVYGDGRKFVEEDGQKYDVVIIDVVDMFDNGPAQALYTRQFYEALRRRLRPGFIIAVQGLEFSLVKFQEHLTLLRTLRTVFPHVISYSAVIPSFLSSWGFAIASDDHDRKGWNARRMDAAIAQKLNSSWLAHLDGQFFEHALSYCRTTKRLFSSPGPILEDNVTLESFDLGPTGSIEVKKTGFQYRR